MKILLDACVWGGASEELQSAGHDVIWDGLKILEMMKY